MKMLRTFMLLLLLTAAQMTAAAGVPAPKGWRFPVASDYLGDWKMWQHVFEKNNSEPFFVRADFNVDGTSDEAWILIPTKKKGWGFWVFLIDARSVTTPTLLASSDKDPAQRMGLGLADPDTYETACGKGYWECSGEETPSVKLRYPGIELYVFESASTLYYYDSKAKKFRGISTSD